MKISNHSLPAPIAKMINNTKNDKYNPGHKVGYSHQNQTQNHPQNGPKTPQFYLVPSNSSQVRSP